MQHTRSEGRREGIVDFSFWVVACLLGGRNACRRAMIVVIKKKKKKDGYLRKRDVDLHVIGREGEVL